MKRLVIVWGVLLFSIYTRAQDRGTPIAPPVISKVVGSITAAKGWRLNEEGNWDSGRNEIKDADQFNSFELRKMRYRDSAFYILVKKYKDGYYKYPAIHEGWVPVNVIYYYVFDSAYVGLLQNVKSQELQTIKIPLRSICYLPFPYVEGGEVKALLRNDPQLKNETVANANFLYLNLQVQPQKNLCRFLIYKVKSYYGDYIDGVKDPDKFTASSDNLKTMYYENSLTNFKNLFKDLAVAQ